MTDLYLDPGDDETLTFGPIADSSGYVDITGWTATLGVWSDRLAASASPSSPDYSATGTIGGDTTTGMAVAFVLPKTVTASPTPLSRVRWYAVRLVDLTGAVQTPDAGRLIFDDGRIRGARVATQFVPTSRRRRRDQYRRHRRGDAVTQRIQLRRGTAAAWATANPVLAAGEAGYEVDTGKLKVGDGAAAWTALAYVTTAALAAAATAQAAADANTTALAAKAPLASPVLTGTPTAPTAALGTNTTQVSTTAFVRAEVAALVASAPGTLDTLGEIATALQADESTAAALATTVAGKAAKSANLSDLASTSTALANLGGATSAALTSEVSRATAAEGANATAAAAAQTTANAAVPLLTYGLRAWALSGAYALSSVSRDANGVLASATVTWPDGATGSFVTDQASVFGVSAYHVTHVAGGTTITLTQAAITRDSLGSVTDMPALTVS